jgi:hypothetical protein
MPAGYANGLQTNFRYLTMKQARDNGIPDSGQFGVSDLRLPSLIRDMSMWINRLTDQWFLPARLRERTDSSRSSVARLPNQIPILDFFNLILEKPNLVTLIFPEVAYLVKQRYVMMIDRHTRLPEMPHFIVLDGVFGWLEDESRIVRTVTTAPVAVGATAIPVANATGFFIEDALLIGRDPEPRYYDVVAGQGPKLQSGPIILSEAPTGVTPVPNTLYCDPVEFGIPVAGVPVVRYGRVPSLIQRACLLLIRDHVQKVGDIDTAESPGGIGTRLNSESVEGYSYSMSPLKAINGPGGGSWTTGNAEVDDILQQYSAPNLFFGMAYGGRVGDSEPEQGAGLRALFDERRRFRGETSPREGWEIRPERWGRGVG